MYLTKDKLENLSEDTKELIISGQFFLYKTLKDHLSYLIRVKDNLYFGLDDTGVVKNKYSHIDKSDIIENVFFDSKPKHAIALNVSF